MFVDTAQFRPVLEKNQRNLDLHNCDALCEDTNQLSNKEEGEDMSSQTTEFPVKEKIEKIEKIEQKNQETSPKEPVLKSNTPLN